MKSRPVRFAESAGLLAALCASMARHAVAQTYPAKAVRYIVPMSAGSGADTIGRIVAAGNLGADIAAKSPADGYTLFQVSSTHAANVSLYRRLSYDLVKDFAPVTQLASSPAMLVVHPSLPVKSVAELVKLTRLHPGDLNYASTGAGSATFLAAELFKHMAGVNIVHVPYRGGGEAVTAIIAGEVSVYFAPMAAILPYQRQGRVRALAESGYSGYQAGNWYGLVAPVKTARDIVAAVRAAAVAAMNDAATRKRLVDPGYIIVGDQPDEFAAFIKSEIAMLGKIIAQTGLTVE